MATYEKVKTAVIALIAVGTPVTLHAIRDFVGGGSLTTIKKLYDQFLSKEEKERTSSLRQLPPKIQEDIFDYIDEEISKASARLVAEAAQSTQLITDLCAKNDLQDEAISEQREKIEELDTGMAVIEGKRAQLLSELETTRNQLAEERRGAELARRESANLQLRLDAITENFTESREACGRLQQQIHDLAERLEKEHNSRVLAERDLAVAAALRAGNLSTNTQSSRRKANRRPLINGSPHR
jgi:chromosome segregation ATPase